MLTNFKKKHILLLLFFQTVLYLVKSTVQEGGSFFRTPLFASIKVLCWVSSNIWAFHHPMVYQVGYLGERSWPFSGSSRRLFLLPIQQERGTVIFIPDCTTPEYEPEGLEGLQGLELCTLLLTDKTRPPWAILSPRKFIFKISQPTYKAVYALNKWLL